MKKEQAKLYQRRIRAERIAAGLCTYCGVSAATTNHRPQGKGRRCDPCRVSRRAAMNAWKTQKRAQWSAAGLCHRCGKSREGSDTVECLSCRNKLKAAYWSVHRLKRLQHHKEEHFALKLEVFEAYGGCICKCCGETHVEFLSIDHIDGQGAAHRKIVNGASLYRWLKRNNYPPGFRVLCMNCNFARGRFGYCPHEKLVTA